MRKKAIIILMVLSVIAGMLTACGSQGAAAGEDSSTEGEAPKDTEAENNESGEKEKLTVRVGDMPNFFIFKVADSKGFFKEEFEKDGIDFEVINFVNSGPAIVESFAAGELDLALLGGQPFIQARANNIDIKGIASNNFTERGFALVATEESGINSLSDLKGKKIAASIGTNSHQVLLQFLEKEGISEDEVEILNLKSSEALASLESNEIDGAIFTEPQISIAVNNGNKLISDATGYGNIVCITVGRNEFLKAHPDVVERFLKVLDKSQKWIEDNKEEASEINAAISEAAPEDVKINLESRDRKISIDDDKLKDPIVATIKFLEGQGLINKEAVSIDDAIDTSYFKASGIE